MSLSASSVGLCFFQVVLTYGKIETQAESFLINNCLWSHLCWPLGALVPNGAVFVLTSEIPVQLARGVALIRFGDSDPFLSLSAPRQH